MKQCGLKKVNLLSQGHMIRDHVRDGTRHQIWRQKEFIVSLPTGAWTCPISKSLETEESLLKGKTQVLETLLATHPHFCLNRILRGPTGKSSAPHCAIPCGKTWEPAPPREALSYSCPLVRKTLSPKHLITSECVPSGAFLPQVVLSEAPCNRRSKS